MKYKIIENVNDLFVGMENMKLMIYKCSMFFDL